MVMRPVRGFCLVRFQKCVVQVNFCHNFKEREVRDVRVDYYIDLWFWFCSRDLIGGRLF